MDLIYTNSSMQAIGVMKAYDLDLAFGSDENDFEIKVDANNHCCEAGYYVYIIGTEYGGVIDAVTSDTKTGEVTYTGRTWHGILNSKVICPDAGQDYLTLNNEANGVLNSLITRMGLTSIFTVNIYASGLEISNYKMPRYVTGYDGIMQMLKSVGGKLVLSFDGEKVILSAAPIADHTKDGSVSSDAMSFQVKTTLKKVNHLICLGQGELKDRTVVHLYADASGSISQTQTLTGADEYAAVYDYPSAESAQKLIEAGASRLAELQNQDNLSVSLNEAEYAFDVGDVVGAVDTVTGISVSVPITKKIVSIRNDYMSVSYETAIGKNGTSSSGSSGGSSGGGGGGAHLHLKTLRAQEAAVAPGIHLEGIRAAGGETERWQNQPVVHAAVVGIVNHCRLVVVTVIPRLVVAVRIDDGHRRKIGGGVKRLAIRQSCACHHRHRCRCCDNCCQ